MTVTTVFAGTNDGNISSSNATYATARSGSGLVADTASIILTAGGQDLSFTTYDVYEGFFSFDTSPVPDADTISAVVLSLKGDDAGSSPTFSLQARVFNWGATLTTADWIAGASLSGNTLVATFATSGWSITAYNAFTESGTAFRTAINKTGTTFLMTCSDQTVSGTTPTDTNQLVNVWMADNAGTTSDPKLVITSSSVAASTLTAAVGSFTETGIAAGLSVGRKLTAATGAFVETGIADSFHKTLIMHCVPNSPSSPSPLESLRKITRLSSVGSFVITGQASSLLVARRLTASPGSFALTGNAAELDPRLFGREATGIYTITGQSAGLTVALHLTAAPGSFAITGNDANLHAGPTLVAGTGSYLLTGQDASLHVSLHLQAGTGSYLVTGGDVAFPVMLSIQAQRGTFVINLSDAALLKALHLLAGPGSYLITGQAAGLLVTPASGTIDYTLFAGPGAYVLAGQAAGLTIVRATPTIPRRPGGFPGPPIPTPRTKQPEPVIPKLHAKLSAETGRFVVTGQPVAFEAVGGTPEIPSALPVLAAPRAIVMKAEPGHVGARTSTPARAHVARVLQAEGMAWEVETMTATLTREPYADGDEEWIILERFILRGGQ